MNAANYVITARKNWRIFCQCGQKFAPGFAIKTWPRAFKNLSFSSRKHVTDKLIGKKCCSYFAGILA